MCNITENGRDESLQALLVVVLVFNYLAGAETWEKSGQIVKIYLFSTLECVVYL